MKDPWRAATVADLELLAGWMRDFYAESGLTLPLARARAAFAPLLSSPAPGSVWILTTAEHEAGYLVVAHRHSMTHGGRIGVVDDFYVLPAFRGQGLGTAAVAALASHGGTHGWRALLVEVGREETATLAFYRRAGFREQSTLPLVLELAPPLHVP